MAHLSNKKKQSEHARSPSEAETLVTKPPEQGLF